MKLTTWKVFIFSIFINWVATQIAVPFTIEQTSKLIPVSLNIQKNFVESAQFQQIFGVFEYYLKAPEGIFYSYWDQNSNQCRYDVKNKQCVGEAQGIIFPADTAMPIFPFIIHKVKVHLWIYQDQNPKKGETWKFVASLCELDSFFMQCNQNITRFSFYLRIL